jgi:polyphenol oxidase
MHLFENYPELLAAVSGKEDGSCRVRLAGDATVDTAARENRKTFAQKIGVGYENIVSGDLVHGNTIAVVSKTDAGRVLAGVDGIVTNARGVFLSVTVADCLPVFLYDPVLGNIGLVHCGWRGLSKNIIESATAKMVLDLGSAPHNIRAAIGPGIGVCHFEVQNDVLEKFSKYRDRALKQEGGKTYLDLKRIAHLQLLREGILQDNIETSGECTHCLDSKYFSFRRDKPQVLETMMAVIGFKE